MNQKTIDKLTNKWTIILAALIPILGGGGYVGYKKSAPVMEQVVDHVILIKTNQEKSHDNEDAMYNLMLGIYTNQMVDLYTRFPRSYIDSTIDLVEKEIFWKMEH